MDLQVHRQGLLERRRAARITRRLAERRFGTTAGGQRWRRAEPVAFGVLVGASALGGVALLLS